MSDQHDHYHDDFEDVCPNCGGEGVVYDCQDEIGCIDPESGCDLCERRCDWCRPRQSKPIPKTQRDEP